METRVPPTHRYPTRWKLGRRRQNSRSSLSQEKPRVFAPCKRKRNKEKRHTRVIDLPKEVIFTILLFLPAKLLQEVVRYVCKQWYDIISEPSFIRAHCQIPITTTTASFIKQSHNDRHMVYCLDKDVTKIILPFAANIQSSCNGLVLFCDNCDTQKIYLANPLRKLIVSLPRVVPLVLEKPFRTSCSFAVNSSGQYKMVHFTVSATLTNNNCEMGVFTIGFDKAWRRIDLQHLLGISKNRAANITLYSTHRHGLLIAGFLYWPSEYTHFLAMEVDTETFYQISKPTDEGTIYQFISMETSLGLMIEDDEKRGMWKLLKLTDVKSSEWTEIAMIDIGAMVIKVDLGRYYGPCTNPVSLIDGEFCFSLIKSFTWMIRYNLANESFVSFEVKVPYDNRCFIHHVPTYVSPKDLTLSKVE